jgi:hypothetical protein
MHRAATLITTLVLLLTLSLQTAIARQATPAAAGASGPDVGATISVLGTEGTEVATVTVTELTDPFDGYDPNSPPDRGFHFVLLTVTISNTGTRPYEANPSHLSLVDADGFTYDQGSL